MKEYLLLRNNAQSGPYTLEELRGMGLKAYDLVWVENKSFSWKYPSEMVDLADYAPPLEQVNHEPFKVEKTHLNIDVDDLARVLPGIKKESKKVVEQAPVRQMNHVIALKPKIEHIEIKTIKSVSQPNIVKVEVREKDPQKIPSITHETSEIAVDNHLVDEVTESFVDVIPNVPDPAKGSAERVYFNETGKETTLATDNKLEIFVLAIGAASLLAVIYLLLTTGYQY